MYYPTSAESLLDDIEEEEAPSGSNSMIIASYSKDKIVELMGLNTSRHCYGHSVASYDLENKAMFSVLRGPGELSRNKLDNNGMFYNIVYLHLAPCGKNIQPPSLFIESTEHYLWMNGELTQLERDKLQFEEDKKETWDAMLLCAHVARYGAPVDVDGSFACMYCDGTDIYMFKNEKESLFFDDDFNVCSVPFVGSRVLPSNRMWEMNMDKKTLKQVDDFSDHPALVSKAVTKATNPFQLLREFFFPTEEEKKEQQKERLKKLLKIIEGGKK